MKIKRLKRFLVFGYDHYYPAGGMEDVQATFETFDEAFDYVENSEDRYNEYEIFDTMTLKVWEISP